MQQMQHQSAQVKVSRSPEVAQSLLRIAQSTMAEDLANSPLGLHTAQVCKPLIMQDLLLSAGPPHASTLVVQPHTLNLQGYRVCFWQLQMEVGNAWDAMLLHLDKD